MKKDKKCKSDDLRPEYDKSDFTGPFELGKYAKKLAESSNIVVLRPEVAEVFPNDEAVNDALSSLVKIARRTSKSRTKARRSAE